MTRFKFIKQTNSTEQHNKPGYVYLVLASGYHGIIPGKFPGVRRCKIGLSVDPNMRLQQLESIKKAEVRSRSVSVREASPTGEGEGRGQKESL